MTLHTEPRRIALLAAAAAGLVLCTGCNSQRAEKEDQDLPMNSVIVPDNQPVQGVAAPSGADAGTLAAQADEAANFSGDSAELAEKLSGLSNAVQEAAPGLPEAIRGPVSEDLTSMQQAVDSGDWEGAQEAAASIASNLEGR